MESKANRGSGDQSVGGVRLLAQRVAGRLHRAKLCIGGNELGAAVNSLDPMKLRFQPEHPSVAPASTDPAVPQLSNRLKEMNAGRNVKTTHSVLRAATRERDPAAEAVCVDEIGPATRPRSRIDGAPETQRPPPRSRSSITISSCGGSGQTGAVAPRLAARDALRDGPARASTRLKYRPCRQRRIAGSITSPAPRQPALVRPGHEPGPARPEIRPADSDRALRSPFRLRRGMSSSSSITCP